MGAIVAASLESSVCTEAVEVVSMAVVAPWTPEVAAERMVRSKYH